MPISPTLACTLLFPLTILVSSFLLFQVQPMMAKFILPWFGGTPAVWTTCMLFFQSGLLLGYGYAHALSRMSPRSQFLVHVPLVLLAILALPITPSRAERLAQSHSPAFQILLVLVLAVGLPYIVLSATAPLVQRWHSLLSRGGNPYRLYAVSNFSSLAALLSYPFLIEPRSSVAAQTALWSAAFLGFGALVAFSVIAVRKAHTLPTNESADSIPPALRTKALWFVLAAAASTLLLAITNHVCQDVAVVPFLWILPLSLYLISFILCFESDRWYRRTAYVPLLALLTLLFCDADFTGPHASLIGAVTISFSLLFVACMICHGELALMRPTPKHLTEFYLILSAGGAFGGVFVGLIAPKVFVSFLELQLALAVVFLCSGWLVLRSLSSDDPNMKHKRLILSVAGVLVVYVLASNARAFQTGAVLQSRNFFGVLRVTEEDADTPELHRYLQYHGRILHGFEYTSPERRHLPNAYYRPDGGLGLAMRLVRNAEGRHIGVVGLGVGTIAAYGEAADRLRFYEINPDVIDQAQQFFHYLRDTKAAVSVIPGDGRLSLAAEDAQAFDILVLDAFSGDAVPAHLLTTEAFEIYDRHLQSSGVIVINITNAHIDLRPVVAAIAEQRGITWRVIRSAKDPARGFQAADWMLLSRNEKFLSEPELVSAASATEGAFERILWTDNSNNLFRILK